MEQVTINDVRQGVLQALEEAFPEIPVAEQETEEPPGEPRLLALLLETTHTKELNRRYRRNHSFVIRYSGAELSEGDLYAMAEGLPEALQRIVVAGYPAAGTGMQFEIAEGALRFYISYNFWVWAMNDFDPLMETLGVKEEIKP